MPHAADSGISDSYCIGVRLAVLYKLLHRIVGRAGINRKSAEGGIKIADRLKICIVKANIGYIWQAPKVLEGY
mgnify:CR=1 FL=1